MRRRIQFAALTLSGLLAGNELGTLIGAHPALRALPLKSEIGAEQALTRQLGKIMPGYTTVTLTAAIAAAVDRRSTSQFGLTAAAATALATMLGITGLGNVGLNKRTLSYPDDGEVDDWEEIRRQLRLLQRLGATASVVKQRAGLVVTDFGVEADVAEHLERSRQHVIGLCGPTKFECACEG